MSQESVELVMGLQRAPDDDFAQLIRDDEMWAQLAEAVAPFVHAEAETARPGLPGGRTYTGLDGFRESWLDWLAPYAEYRTEVEEAIDCGERVLLLQSSSGRLEGSTKEVKLAPSIRSATGRSPASSPMPTGPRPSRPSGYGDWRAGGKPNQKREGARAKAADGSRAQ
jgi:hypothetical protein